MTVKCGRCGRKLTTYDSTNRGFGPRCFEIVREILRKKLKNLKEVFG